MAKYSFDFKKRIVEDYLAGKGGTRYLADKYNVPALSNVQKWISNYQAFGDEGLMRSRKQMKQLEDELLKLKIKNAYLKELRRLRLEEETLLKKQRGSSTASEENSN